jgi:hypothetical protein
MSETSKNHKSKLISKFIIGLSISFFLLSYIITFKALGIPFSNSDYKTTPKELDPVELDLRNVLRSEKMLRKPAKKQTGGRIVDDDEISNKNKETQKIDNKSVIQERSDNINEEKKLNGKLKTDDQYASRLVYTIQIASQPAFAVAQKNFNFIIRSLNEKNLNLLRIEKVGKYYTVRLGKFENYEIAKKFIQENNPQLSDAIILKAHIKKESIKSFYE